MSRLKKSGRKGILKQIMGSWYCPVFQMKMMTVKIIYWAVFLKSSWRYETFKIKRFRYLTFSIHATVSLIKGPYYTIEEFKFF
jgi:hypothetical protein